MAFKLGDLVIDRIQYAMASDLNDNPLYVLTQLSDATIEVTAESKDATDANGNLVKRFWMAKTGTFTASNAMLNLNILAAKSGSDAVIASAGSTIEMPVIKTVDAGATLDITGYEAGTVTVNALSADGSMGQAYELDTTASATKFTISSNILTPPTDTNETRYIVCFHRVISEGTEIVNYANKFPNTIKLTIKALCVSPCSADTLQSVYIVLPSFQPSPETSISLTTDGTLEYSGDLQISYCEQDHPLYMVYFDPNDDED